jgi:hypothetical protein
MACKRELDDLYEHGFADLAGDFEENIDVFLD